MGKARRPPARDKLISSASELMRRNGYVATSVEDVCAEAGVTKGAFFHYFETKEVLGEACLKAWDAQTMAMIQTAPFQAVADPVQKVLACVDFLIAVFGNPRAIKSCLAGTTVQEVSESHPNLRKAANACFVNGEKRFKSLLDEACKASQRKLDTASLATMLFATIQGSFILSKASRNHSVVADNLAHFKQYIALLFSDRPV